MREPARTRERVRVSGVRDPAALVRDLAVLVAGRLDRGDERSGAQGRQTTVSGAKVRVPDKNDDFFAKLLICLCSTTHSAQVGLTT
jgi:hypothetical protein